MNELEFIELSLRYLDGAADRREIDRLGAEMIDRPERRGLYRDLVRQSQLLHEWLATQPPARTARPSRKIAPALGLAAAAAVVLLGAIAIRQAMVPGLGEPESAAIAAAPPPEPYFGDEAPSWADIYHSPFDYPEFVWRAEISAGAAGARTLDEFTVSGQLSLVAATPAAEFRRLLAPIALIPASDPFDP